MKFCNLKNAPLLLGSIVSFILISINFLLLSNSTPEGYKINIYSQLPSYFWVNLTIIYFIGCILVLQRKDFFKKIGISSLLINYLSIFLVPISLGYFIYGTSDELTHLGEIKNIVLTGHVDRFNVYPLTHIIYSMVSLIVNLEPNLVSSILPSIFSIVFILGIIAFSKLYLGFEQNLIPIVFLSSLIYYFGHFHFSNVPNFSYFSLVPVILYSMGKYLHHRDFSISTVVTIFIVTICFAHPFVWLFIGYLLALIILSKKYLPQISNVYTIFLLLASTFVLWFIKSFYLQEFSKIYNSFVNSQIDSVAIKGFSLLSKIDFSPTELLRFMFLYGGRYIIPIFLICLYAMFFFRSNKYPKDTLRSISQLFMIAVAFGFYQIVLLINPMISHGPDRIMNLNYFLFAMVPLFAVSLYYIFNINGKWKSILTPSLILSLIFSLSVYGAFYSPYIYQPNIGTTYNEVDGMNWLFNHKGSMPIHDLFGESGHRYSSLFYGWSITKEKLGSDVLVTKAGVLQDHFGYDNNEYFNMPNSYIVLTSESTLAYTTIYEKFSKYTISDFYKLENDPKVNKVYDSLNIKILMS